MYLAPTQLPYHLGRYELQEEIGRGAYASVYRARLSGPMGFQKKVALKLARSPLTEGQQDEDEGRIKALVNEARIGGRLQHPNIVEIYEFGRIEGFYFIAMEFVDGLTIGQALDVLKTRGRAIPPGLAIELISQTCEGLAYAHDLTDEAGEHHQVVHRDLKPANLMVARTGLLKVMDFGIAKSAFSLFQTAEGMTKGTPMYMSPEQVYGRPVTPASDIFAVGSILFEMVVGEPLFVGDSVVEIIEKVAEQDAGPRLDSHRDRLGPMLAVLRRCLKKKPNQRYPTTYDLLADIERLRESFPLTQSASSLVREVESIRGGKPRPAPAAPRRREPPPAPEPRPFRRAPIPQFLPEEASLELESTPGSASTTIEVLEVDPDVSARGSAPAPAPGPPPPSRPLPSAPAAPPPAAAGGRTSDRRRGRLGSWSVVLPAMGPDFAARPAMPSARSSPPSDLDLPTLSLELAALPPLKPGSESGSSGGAPG